MSDVGAPLNRIGRVLVIEDDLSVGHLLDIVLTTVGFDVRVATTGHAALEELENMVVDAVVLDLGLPDLDGMSMLVEIKRRWRDIPVVVVTGQGGVRAKVAGLNAGADDYICKPFDIDEVVARLCAVLRRLNALACFVRPMLFSTPSDSKCDEGARQSRSRRLSSELLHILSSTRDALYRKRNSQG